MPIDLAVGHGVVEITMSTPDGNKLGTTQLDELAAALRVAGSRGDAHSIILTGAGGDFCSGRRGTPGLATAAEIRADLEPVLAIGKLIDELPLIVIAAVEGRAHGFGFGLALQADITILARNASLTVPELAAGTPPLLIVSYLARHLPYKTAMGLVLCGHQLDTSDARSLGLATTVTEPGQALPVARDNACWLTEHDPAALAMVKSFGRRTAAVFDLAAMQEAAGLIAGYLAADGGEV